MQPTQQMFAKKVSSLRGAEANVSTNPLLSKSPLLSAFEFNHWLLRTRVESWEDGSMTSLLVTRMENITPVRTNKWSYARSLYGCSAGTGGDVINRLKQKKRYSHLF